MKKEMISLGALIKDFIHQSRCAVSISDPHHVSSRASLDRASDLPTTRHRAPAMATYRYQRLQPVRYSYSPSPPTVMTPNPRAISTSFDSPRVRNRRRDIRSWSPATQAPTCKVRCRMRRSHIHGARFRHLRIHQASSSTTGRLRLLTLRQNSSSLCPA